MARPIDRTVAEAIEAYEESSRFPENARTRKDYDRYLNIIHHEIGTLSLGEIRRRDVLDLQRKFRDTYRKANYTLSVLRLVLDHAMDLDWLQANPAVGVRNLPAPKGAGYRSWSPEQIAAFRAAAEGRSRTWFELTYGLVQRPGDMLRMIWGDVAHGAPVVRIRQSKRGWVGWVPVPEDLQLYLGNLPRGAPMEPIVRGGFGAYSEVSREFRAARSRARLPDNLTMHGLRATGAQELIHGGVSEHEAMAITGHASAQSLKPYLRDRDQKRLAEAAAKARSGIT